MPAGQLDGGQQTVRRGREGGSGLSVNRAVICAGAPHGEGEWREG